MDNTVKNLIGIKESIKTHLNKLEINTNPKIIAVSKTFKIERILPLIEYGHIDEQNKINKKIKIFLQVNIGDEDQKSGISKNDVSSMVLYCKEIGLDLIGLMCIPPVDINPEKYFKEMSMINQSSGFSELSMGMSSDYLMAVKHLSTYVRIGSSIFGRRF
jgi:uncharacterized pyridoxal phosphate-containing UPF0001 family protein